MNLFAEITNAYAMREINRDALRDFHGDFDKLTDKISQGFILDGAVYNNASRSEHGIVDSLDSVKTYLQPTNNSGYLFRDENKINQAISESIDAGKFKGVFQKLGIGPIDLGKYELKRGLQDIDEKLDRKQMLGMLALQTAKSKALLREDGIRPYYGGARKEAEARIELYGKAAEILYNSTDERVKYRLETLLEEASKGSGLKTKQVVGAVGLSFALAGCALGAPTEEKPNFDPVITQASPTEGSNTIIVTPTYETSLAPKLNVEGIATINPYDADHVMIGADLVAQKYAQFIEEDWGSQAKESMNFMEVVGEEGGIGGMLITFETNGVNYLMASNDQKKGLGYLGFVDAETVVMPMVWDKDTNLVNFLAPDMTIKTVFQTDEDGNVVGFLPFGEDDWVTNDSLKNIKPDLAVYPDGFFEFLSSGGYFDVSKNGFVDVNGNVKYLTNKNGELIQATPDLTLLPAGAEQGPDGTYVIHAPTGDVVVATTENGAVTPETWLGYKLYATSAEALQNKMPVDLIMNGKAGDLCQLTAQPMSETVNTKIPIGSWTYDRNGEKLQELRWNKSAQASVDANPSSQPVRFCGYVATESPFADEAQRDYIASVWQWKNPDGSTVFYTLLYNKRVFLAENVEDRQLFWPRFYTPGSGLNSVMESMKLLASIARDTTRFQLLSDWERTGIAPSGLQDMVLMGSTKVGGLKP